MKLRYYLRGLAVGILLSTVILTISNADNQPMTDAQVRQRALELGMIESSAVKLSALQEETGSSSAESSAAESTAASSEPSDSEASAELSSTAASSAAESSVPSSSVAESTAEPITIQVNSGASSYTVSKDLAAAGLVEDAAAYDAYLCNNGYSKRIRVGTYSITPGTSEDDIAKIITQKK